MKKWGVLIASCLLVSLLALPVSAKDYESLDDLFADTQEVVAGSQDQGGEVLDPLPTPAPTEAPQDVEALDGAAAGPLEVVVLDVEDLSSYSVAGVGYTGSISTTYLEYFAGILAQNPRSDYVIFKADRYRIYMFYGKDFTFSGGVFSGSGNFICYNADSQLFSRGSDSFSLSDPGYFVYTNLSAAYPSLYQTEGVNYVKVTAIACGVALCLYAFDRIFFRRRS